MSGFKLGGMTLSSLFKKPETRLYPQQPCDLPPAHKGIVVNNVEECILCSKCAKACPAGALEVDKANRLWIIDRFCCVQCQTCVYNCPKNCLSMDPARPVISTKKYRDEFQVPEKPKKPKADAE